MFVWPGTDVNVPNYPNKNSNEYIFDLDCGQSVRNDLVIFPPPPVNILDI